MDIVPIFQMRILRSKEFAQLVGAVGGARLRASSAEQTSQRRKLGFHSHPESRVSILRLTQPCPMQCAVPSLTLSCGTQDTPTCLLCKGLCISAGGTRGATHAKFCS